MKLGSEHILLVILFEHTWQRHGTVSAFGHYPQPKPIISLFNNQWSNSVLFVYNFTMHQITHTVLPLLSTEVQSSPIYLFQRFILLLTYPECLWTSKEAGTREYPEAGRNGETQDQDVFSVLYWKPVKKIAAITPIYLPPWGLQILHK